MPEVLRVPLEDLEARDPRRAGFAVGDGLDPDLVRFGYGVSEARDGAGVLRLSGVEDLGLGCEVAVVARRPRETLEVVRVHRLVLLRRAPGILDGERAHVLSTAGAGDANPVDVAADAEEAGVGMQAAVPLEQRAPQLVAELAVAQRELERVPFLCRSDRDVRRVHLPGIVYLGDVLGHEPVGPGLAFRPCRGPDRLAGQVVDLVDVDARDQGGRGPQRTDRDLVAQHAVVAGPQLGNVALVFEHVQRSGHSVLFRLLLPEHVARRIARAGHIGQVRLLLFREIFAHPVEAALRAAADTHGQRATRVHNTQRERLVALARIELDLRQRDPLAARLHCDLERMQHLDRHDLEPERYLVVAGGQVRPRRDQGRALGKDQPGTLAAGRALVTHGLRALGDYVLALEQRERDALGSGRQYGGDRHNQAVLHRHRESSCPKWASAQYSVTMSP